MKRKRSILIGMLFLLLVVASLAAAAGESDLAVVRAATAPFHRTGTAQAAGWDLIPGLDHCFENPGVGAMGYHYINASLLDLELMEKEPEAMVYAPGPQGQLMLSAVEYIVPAAAWDAAYPGAMPMVLGHELHLNESLGVYVLHAWIFRHNPDGMFEDWNPDVSCP
jgi:hypothetical protein